jgi:Na+/H+ antiporter
MQGLELIVILAAVIVVCGVVGSRFAIAQPVLLLLAGILLGFAAALREVYLPPEVVLLIFLPALLYWEAITVSLREIRTNIRGVVLMSTLLVVATAAGVAVAAHALGLAWGPAWVLGATIAPTDATAVGTLARNLPRRNVTILRAESLVNDGTALVLYGVAVGVTVSGRSVSMGHITWLIVLSYGGGIAAGALVAWLGVQIRRRIHEPVLGNVVILLIPFTAYLLAELVHASGVLAVVVSGLAMSQIGPRIGQPQTRLQTQAFWSLATFLLNAGLFILIGIQAHSVVRNLASADLFVGIINVAVVYIVILAVRLLFLILAAHTIRLVDRSPRQRQLRVSNKARVVSTVAGFRGAVSLALALSVPATLSSGEPFPDRDLIVLITTGVVAATLIVQGLLLPTAVRWARLPTDTSVLDERRMAYGVAAREALEALPAIAKELGTDRHLVEQLRHEYEAHLETLVAADEEPDQEHDSRAHSVEQEKALRLALLERKRAAVLRLRDQQRIDDTVLRQIQARLDVEEIRLRPEPPVAHG